MNRLGIEWLCATSQDRSLQMLDPSLGFLAVRSADIDHVCQRRIAQKVSAREGADEGHPLISCNWLHGLCRRRSHFADQGKYPVFVEKLVCFGNRDIPPVRNRHCTRSARACGHEPRQRHSPRGTQLIYPPAFRGRGRLPAPSRRRTETRCGHRRRLGLRGGSESPKQAQDDDDSGNVYRSLNRDWHAIFPQTRRHSMSPALKHGSHASLDPSELSYRNRPAHWKPPSVRRYGKSVVPSRSLERCVTNSLSTNGRPSGRCCRTRREACPEWMIDVSSMASFGCWDLARHGVICRRFSPLHYLLQPLRPLAAGWIWSRLRRTCRRPRCRRPDDRPCHRPGASARRLHHSRQAPVHGPVTRRPGRAEIDAVVDTNGLPVRLVLTAGEAHDIQLACRLLSV